MKAIINTSLSIDPTGKLRFTGPQKIIDQLREVYGDSIEYVAQGEIEYEAGSNKEPQTTQIKKTPRGEARGQVVDGSPCRNDMEGSSRRRVDREC